MNPPAFRTVVALLSGAVVGVAAWGAMRFVLSPWPEAPHYHANWAMIVNGVELDFSDDRYMESVSACTAADVMQPVERVHMHNNDDSVVHVHDAGVAWSHFFANIGIAVGADYLIVDDRRRYLAGESATLTLVINGFVVDEIGQRLIRSGDRLLISYGPETAEEVMRQQFPRVAADAESYNERDDPAGCAGSRNLPIRERLRRALWG